jgi:transcriptional regulator with XRE-family HTH domain
VQIYKDLVACRNLRIIRKMSGMTQQEVADRLYMARSSYGAIETGKQAMTFGTACLLAEIFGVDLSIFSASKLKLTHKG